MVGQRLGRAVAHRDDVLDQLSEKFRAWSLSIPRFRRPAGANDVIEFHPMLHQSHPVHAEKAGEGAGFVADQKGVAFRCERIFVAAFLQQFEADERVHDRAQTPS